MLVSEQLQGLIILTLKHQNNKKLQFYQYVTAFESLFQCMETNEFLEFAKLHTHFINSVLAFFNNLIPIVLESYQVYNNQQRQPPQIKQTIRKLHQFTSELSF
jgi:hypothetical protein